MVKRTTPVRVEDNLIEPMKKLIRQAKDASGEKQFQSLTDVASEGVRQVLRAHGIPYSGGRQ
jgi:hypothetical protein